VLDALADQARQIGRLPALLLRTLRNVLAVLRHRRGSTVSTPRPMLDAPRTPLNRALTPHRSFASTSLSLDEVKAVKAAFGVTINDIVLALVGGALRRYLAAQGELPGRSLIAGVPVASDRPGDDVRLKGNKVSNLFTSLATDQPDPVLRLRAIHDVTTEAKVMQDLLGVETMQDWVQYTPPRPYAWAVRQWSKHRIAEQLPPPINVVVSNVPGPRAPLFVGGARLEHLYSVGPVLEGIGLNVTVWSYLDGLDVGVLACREAAPDPHRITAALHEAFAELRHAAGLDASLDDSSPAAPPASATDPVDSSGPAATSVAGAGAGPA
jgi:diacylglycerol O-acyltransferase